jgi:hypothetical protein
MNEQIDGWMDGWKDRVCPVTTSQFSQFEAFSKISAHLRRGQPGTYFVNTLLRRLFHVVDIVFLIPFFLIS